MPWIQHEPDKPEDFKWGFWSAMILVALTVLLVIFWEDAYLLTHDEESLRKEIYRY